MICQAWEINMQFFPGKRKAAKKAKAEKKKKKPLLLTYRFMDSCNPGSEGLSYLGQLVQGL